MCVKVGIRVFHVEARHSHRPKVSAPLLQILAREQAVTEGLAPEVSNLTTCSQNKLSTREVSVTNHHWPCEVRAGGICGSGIGRVQSKEPRPTPPSKLLV